MSTLQFQFSYTTGDDSDVPPLPPPMPPLNDDSDVSPEKSNPSHFLEFLSIEVELQLLLDEVTTLEANYERILQKQDEILSRLTALENRSVYQQMDTPHPFQALMNHASTSHPCIHM
jgi:hypothetical protein